MKLFKFHKYQKQVKTLSTLSETIERLQTARIQALNMNNDNEATMIDILINQTLQKATDYKPEKETTE